MCRPDDFPPYGVTSSTLWWPYRRHDTTEHTTDLERHQGIGAADFHWPYPMEGGWDSSAGHVYAQAIRGAGEMRRRRFNHPDGAPLGKMALEYEDRHPYEGAYRMERIYGCPVRFAP